MSNAGAGAIDTALWSHDPESWIPHGLDDANGVDYCHVWVSSDMAAGPINAKYLFLLCMVVYLPNGMDSRDVSVCLMGSQMRSCNKHVITGKFGKSLITTPLAITRRMRKGGGIKKTNLM